MAIGCIAFDSRWWGRFNFALMFLIGNPSSICHTQLICAVHSLAIWIWMWNYNFWNCIFSQNNSDNYLFYFPHFTYPKPMIRWELNISLLRLISGNENGEIVKNQFIFEYLSCIFNRKYSDFVHLVIFCHWIEIENHGNGEFQRRLR